MLEKYNTLEHLEDYLIYFTQATSKQASSAFRQGSVCVTHAKLTGKSSHPSTRNKSTHHSTRAVQSAPVHQISASNTRAPRVPPPRLPRICGRVTVGATEKQTTRVNKQAAGATPATLANSRQISSLRQPHSTARQRSATYQTEREPARWACRREPHPPSIDTVPSLSTLNATPRSRSSRAKPLLESPSTTGMASSSGGAPSKMVTVMTVDQKVHHLCFLFQNETRF